MIANGPERRPNSAKAAPGPPRRCRPIRTLSLTPLAPGMTWPSAIVARKVWSSIQRRFITISRWSQPALPPPKLVQPSQKNAPKIRQRLTAVAGSSPAWVSATVFSDMDPISQQHLSPSWPGRGMLGESESPDPFRLHLQGVYRRTTALRSRPRWGGKRSAFRRCCGTGIASAGRPKVRPRGGGTCCAFPPCGSCPTDFPTPAGCKLLNLSGCGTNQQRFCHLQRIHGCIRSLPPT